MRILIVDDEELIRVDYGSIAEAHGHKVIAASGVAGARVILQVTHFDFIILDKDLPYIDEGLGLVELARHHNPEAVIWLISGRMDDTAKAKAIELGADKAMCKPAEFHTAVMGHLVQPSLASVA